MPSDPRAERDHLVWLDRGWSAWRLAALRSAGLPFDALAPFAAKDALALPRGPERVRAVRAATRAATDGAVLDKTLSCALTWQNPQVVANWVGGYAAALAAGERPELTRMDRREALVARYAQRYCAKNDTVGFFGPVGWARLGASASGTTGMGEITRYQVHFEVWAVQAVARAWHTDPELRDHLPVRLDPACTAGDGVVRRPSGAPVELDSTAGAVVDALAETPDVGAIVRRFGEDVRPVLDWLCHKGIVRVGFVVPLDSGPERSLRTQVEALTDHGLRARLIGVLDEFEQVRAAVAAVAADPVALPAALAAVDERLVAAAGASGSAGLAAGGRTPVYLDCRRDLDMTVGDDLLEPLAGPLAVVLDSARWLAGEVGEVVHDALRERYRRLADRPGGVTLADLQLACADVLSPGSDLLSAVVSDFQQRWAEILRGGDVSFEWARRLADALFPAGGRLWSAARSHSPDLMIRDLGGGRAGWVLGELHVALNTLESRVFREQADDPAELVDALAADVAPGRVVPVYPNSSPEISSRTYPPLALDPPGRYRYWSYGFDDGHPSGVPSTPATSLFVTERDGELVASGDGWEAPVTECFGEFLTALAVNLFHVLPPTPHSPRVGIGDLVVSRESWRLSAHDPGPVPSRSDDDCHDTLRAWAERHGMPRHVFVKTPAEFKPFYVDFLAPALVDNLARALRRAAAGPAEHAHVDVVEMLPGPDELRLRGPKGSYTSELRLVAVDPEPAPPASWPAHR